MQYQASATARHHAKSLRTGMTDAERRLWSRLRLQQLGSKFRRQHPVGPFVVDFVCLDAKLVIEVDGSQHLGQGTYDARRSEWLQAQGFVVLRFWANEFLASLDGVVSAIQQSLAGRQPAPTPALPQRRREPEPVRSAGRRSWTAVPRA
jgi:very-short-patch-repair endonuclease